MPLLNNRRKPYRKLTNVRVDEISVVDVGAGEGVRIKLLKRDRVFGGYPMPGMRKNLDVPVDPDKPINPGGAELDDDDDADYTEHLSDDAGAGDDDEDDEPTNNDGADPNGAPTKHLSDLVEQLDKQQKDQAMSKLKSLDVVKVCKAMAADGDAYGTSEHELVDWLDRYAKAHNTNFVALYERNDDVGLAIRKAVDIAKHAGFGVSSPYLKAATLEPKQVGGRDARNVDDPRSALDQINDLIAEQRRQHPELELTDAQWFARVYSDPANREIVKRERRENRPI
jgi:hypothetical protein